MNPVYSQQQPEQAPYQTAYTAPQAPYQPQTQVHHTKARRQATPFLVCVNESIPALGLIALAVALWWCGAYFTLEALTAIGIPVAQLGHWQWTIPGVISAIELRYWPKRNISQTKALAFSVISAVDLLSTVYGLLEWAPGRTIPLGTGYTFTEDKQALFGVAIGTSIAFTFIPERLLLWSIAELRSIWGV